MSKSLNLKNQPKTQSGKLVIESFERFERRLWERNPLIWFGSLLAPLLLTALAILGVYLFSGMIAVNRLIVATLATAMVFGRFVILFGQSSEIAPDSIEASSMWFGSLQELANISSLELFGLVMYLDLIVAAFLAFHLGFIFKVPFIGPRVADLIGDSQTLLNSHPRIKRISFVGLVLFVMFPTSTTGSVGGSIFGRLMGLSRSTTFGAIAIGSLFGNGLMYLLAGQVNKYVDKDDWWLKLIGVLFCLIIMVFLERRYRHMQKTAREEQAKLVADTLDQGEQSGEQAGEQSGEATPHSVSDATEGPQSRPKRVAAAGEQSESRGSTKSLSTESLSTEVLSEENSETS